MSAGALQWTRQVWAILRKDLLLELRSKEALSSMLVFGVLVLVIFHFAIDFSNLLDEEVRSIAPGVLWVAFLFAGILGLNRSFAVEGENDCLQGLLMTPVDRGGIFLSKWMANFLFMTVAEAVLLPLFAVFFNLDVVHQLPRLALVAVAGTFGFTAVGTLFAAIAANTRMREVLLPILLLPVCLPIVLSAVQSTGLVLEGGSAEAQAGWLQVLGACDLVFPAACLMTFEYVVEE